MCENLSALMENNRRRSLRLKKILFAAVLAVACVSLAYAFLHRNNWIVPEDAKSLSNPLPPSAAALRAASPLYHENCAQCHGEEGKGDGPEGKMYDPSPADFTAAKRMNPLTDGQIFYQISEGRKPMPSFKKKLSTEQRWQLVLFVRSFAAKTSGPGKESPATSKP
jgi:mono/diheme cytochrome c family protein